MSIKSSVDLFLGGSVCSKAISSENTDLFYELSGSYGSLGMLTAAEVPLILFKEFVLLRYHLFFSPIATLQGEFLHYTVLRRMASTASILAYTGCLLTRHPWKRSQRSWSIKRRALGGRKVPYSRSYYTEEEFWAICSREACDGL